MNYKDFKFSRIYVPARRLETVDQRVQNYCFKKESAFYIPSVEQLYSVDVVVTTIDMCLSLYESGFKNQFTHILIDEAGQVPEYEIIQAFLLANTKSVIVLAGDHKQMNLPVYSENPGVNNSLLERLIK